MRCQVDNLIKFPKAKRSIPANAILDVTPCSFHHDLRRIQLLPVHIVLNILIFLLGCLRTLVLTLLLWFRPILFGVIQPLSGLMLIGFIVCLFTQPHDHRLYYLFGLASLVSFFAMHLYDGLLILLSRGKLITIFH